MRRGGTGFTASAPGRCISSSEGVAAEQTGSRAAGTGGGTGRCGGAPGESARGLETRFDVNIPRLWPGLIIVAMGGTLGKTGTDA